MVIIPTGLQMFRSQNTKDLKTIGIPMQKSKISLTMIELMNSLLLICQ